MTSYNPTPAEQQALIRGWQEYTSFLKELKIDHPYLESYNFEIYDQINQVFLTLMNNHTLSTRAEEFLEELEDKKDEVITRLQDTKSPTYIKMMSSRSYDLTEELELLNSLKTYSEMLKSNPVSHRYIQRYNTCVYEQINQIFNVLKALNKIGYRADEALKEVELNKHDLVFWFSSDDGYCCERSHQSRLNQEPRNNHTLLAVTRAHRLSSQQTFEGTDNSSATSSLNDLLEEWELDF